LCETAQWWRLALMIRANSILSISARGRAMPPDYHSKQDVNNAAVPEWSEYANGLVMVRLADVEPKPIAWLWPARFPRGKLSIIAGDPGLGKSLLTLDMIARVTRGRAWPDGTHCQAGEAILLSAEDEGADTIRPRLDALGADVTRVQLLEGTQEVAEDGKIRERLFSLRCDIERLSLELEKSPQCALLVIDPITAYLDGTKSHENAEVRSVLAPLSKLAAAHNVAIIGINHLNKGTHAKAIYRVMGSLAFGATARAAWGVAEDPNDKERRLLLSLKQNLSANHGGLAYWVRPSLSNPEIPIIEWAPDPIEMTAQEAFMPQVGDDGSSAEDEAGDWLRDVLADRDIDGMEIKRMAKEAGIAERTLYRAAKRKGVRMHSGGFGKPRIWSMSAKSSHVCQPSSIGTDGTHGEIRGALEPCPACGDTGFWRPEGEGNWRCCKCKTADPRLGRLEFAEAHRG
jgi:hypothetical protein